jgi:hypothetical protein
MAALLEVGADFTFESFAKLQCFLENDLRNQAKPLERNDDAHIKSVSAKTTHAPAARRCGWPMSRAIWLQGGATARALQRA